MDVSATRSRLGCCAVSYLLCILRIFQIHSMRSGAWTSGGRQDSQAHHSNPRAQDVRAVIQWEWDGKVWMIEDVGYIATLRTRTPNCRAIRRVATTGRPESVVPRISCKLVGCEIQIVRVHRAIVFCRIFLSRKFPPNLSGIRKGKKILSQSESSPKYFSEYSDT